MVALMLDGWPVMLLLTYWADVMVFMSYNSASAWYMQLSTATAEPAVREAQPVVANNAPCTVAKETEVAVPVSKAPAA